VLTIFFVPDLNHATDDGSGFCAYMHRHEDIGYWKVLTVKYPKGPKDPVNKNGNMSMDGVGKYFLIIKCLANFCISGVIHNNVVDWVRSTETL
jgi:hypothetical protein